MVNSLQEGKLWIKSCYMNKAGDHLRTLIPEKPNTASPTTAKCPHMYAHTHTATLPQAVYD